MFEEEKISRKLCAEYNSSSIQFESKDGIKKGVILAFDLDHTLLTTNISFIFGKELYQRRLVSTSTVLASFLVWFLHRIGLVSSKYLHHKLFNFLFRGIDKRILDKVIEEKLANFLMPETGKTLFRASLLQEIEEKKITNDSVISYIIILSSSPDFLVKHCVKILQNITNYAFLDWKSTCYEIDSLNRFERVSYVMSGREKVEELKRVQKELTEETGITEWTTCGYSDSIRDLPLLQAVSHAICVAPSLLLRVVACIKRWKIVEN